MDPDSAGTRGNVGLHRLLRLGGLHRLQTAIVSQVDDHVRLRGRDLLVGEEKTDARVHLLAIAEQRTQHGFGLGLLGG